MDTPRILHVGPDPYIEHLQLRALGSDDVIGFRSVMEEVEEKEKTLLLAIEAINIDMAPMNDYFPEPKEKFKSRWKGGVGPGSTAPIKRGKKR